MTWHIVNSIWPSVAGFGLGALTAWGFEKWDRRK